MKELLDNNKHSQGWKQKPVKSSKATLHTYLIHLQNIENQQKLKRYLAHLPTSSTKHLHLANARKLPCTSTNTFIWQKLERYPAHLPTSSTKHLHLAKAQKIPCTSTYFIYKTPSFDKSSKDTLHIFLLHLQNTFIWQSSKDTLHIFLLHLQNTFIWQLKYQQKLKRYPAHLLLLQKHLRSTACIS